MLPFELFRVEGESMLPTYHPGDLLLGRRWFLQVKVGDIVVVVVEKRCLIKRVASISGGKLEVLGDNSSFSTDSRSFGSINILSIKAKVICRLAKSQVLEKPLP
jgi:phage repressor protein C with HTH and peptisase S24 domain